MNDNVTLDPFIDEEQYEIVDFSEELREYDIRSLIEKCVLPFLIIIGTFCNVLALVILIRRRLWLQHEGYLYLAAILISNIVQLDAICGSRWLYLFHHSYHIANTADFMCKFWTLLTRVIQSAGWLMDALLFNIYLHWSLSKRCGCPNVAAKYCTLFGTQVVLVLYLMVSVLINLWLFAITSLHYFMNETFCYAAEIFDAEIMLLKLVSDFLANFFPTMVLVPVLWLMVVCTRRSNSGFSFRDIDDGDGNNSNAQDLAKASLCCAAALFFLRSPLYLMHMLTEFHFFHHYPYRLFFALHLISWTYPVSVPIICLTVLTRFREDVKSMTEDVIQSLNVCCRRRILSSDANRNGSTAIQLDLIMVDPLASSQRDFSIK